ncbi:MAG TPA: OadG family transporter subunit [Propionicimonas sp.]|nr:OadG family transporter subunit [Propionicimonas sp.]HRA05932.1 OadG family transporter subunit [Propionicimonas sp.]
MGDLGFGLYLAAAGMGTVFAVLLALMLVLKLIGRLDRPTHRTGERASAADADAIDAGGTDEPPDGLTPELIAAITIAVITHARVRRSQAAPSMRRVAPGSQLFASRWVAVGRGYQNQPWK